MSRKKQEHPAVFISYSHKDEAWKDRLKPHLKMLEQAGRVIVWDDRMIDAGDQWYERITEAMEGSQVAICLISPDYLASDFCIKEEIPYFLEKRKTEGMLILPVLIRSCFWEVFDWLSKTQMLPRDGKSVADDFANTYDVVFTEVAKRVNKVAIQGQPVQVPVKKVPWKRPASRFIDYKERLPQTGHMLFGRKKELKLLDEIWEKQQANVISFVAWGGVGKSTLINRWLERMDADHFRGAKRVYGWSFYSQGTNERVTSSDKFIAHALEWFGDKETTESSKSPWDKGARLAELIREEKTLLILDGLEPLQSGFDYEKDKLKDAALEVLLRNLAKDNNGLCVITTRENIADLANLEGGTVCRIDLDQISSEAGEALLRVAGIRGTDKQLRKASEAFGNHALAINLLGRYLHGIEGHSIEHASNIPDLPNISVEDGRHPRRVMEAFAERFGDSGQIETLEILGLFDRPAALKAFEAVLGDVPIAGLTDHLSALNRQERQEVFEYLRECGLVAKKSHHDPDELDCHPLVREHFGGKLKAEKPEAWKEAHSRLYEYYKNLPEKELPDTLEEMEPLFRAVYHGCQAGNYQEIYYEIYLNRIQRRDYYYLAYKLGAYGSLLGVLSCFFDRPWIKPSIILKDSNKSLILNNTGFVLRAIGRLREAIEPMKVGLEIHEKNKDWEHAASEAGNLSELFLVIGDVRQAVTFGQRCMDYADQSKNTFWAIVSRTTCADAFHQMGKVVEAQKLFGQAEMMQREYPYLYSMRGYQYCALLLTLDRVEEIKERVTQMMEITKGAGFSLLTQAFERLTIGRANLKEFCISNIRFPNDNEMNNKILVEAKKWLDAAVDEFRKAGQQQYIPCGLFARAEMYRVVGDCEKARWDVDEAREIAERSQMGLWIVDALLEEGRIYRAEGNVEKAKECGEIAKELIEKTGYHRRDGEAEELCN